MICQDFVLISILITTKYLTDVRLIETNVFKVKESDRSSVLLILQEPKLRI